MLAGAVRPQRRARRGDAGRAGPVGRRCARNLRNALRRGHRVPEGEGIWRDDERGGALVRDEPVVVHCYTTPEEIENADNLGRLAHFCRRMGRETNQGEIGLVIGDEYFAIRDYKEAKR